MSLTLASFNKRFIINRYSAIEGGYVNDPSDLGGETNHGVTKGLTDYPRVNEGLKKLGWNGKMKDLTKEMAFWVYETEFWNKMRCDDLLTINPLLADKVFDIGINGGRIRVITWLQEFLNVQNNEQKLYADLKIDGGMGNITLGTLKSYLDHRGKKGTTILIHALIAKQTAHYWEISLGREKNERYQWGWTIRAFDSAVEYNKVMGLYS